MRSLKRILESLRESQYLEAKYLDNGKNIIDAKLLKNGKIFQNNLLHLWKTFTSGTNQHDVREVFYSNEDKTRLSFLHRTEFKNSCHELCLTNDITADPTIIKTVENRPLRLKDATFFCMKYPNTIRLVTDYFVHAINGLDTFYSIQRERKIWWMRYSADPSRYFVEPFDVEQNCGEVMIRNSVHNKSKSMTVKSLFPYGSMDMENITLVWLNEFNKELHVQVALVRSVIDLNMSTCALLLDGSGYNRNNVLLLNTKLAPYQCLLATICVDKTNKSIFDLCLHIGHILRGAGLRLYKTPLHVNSQKELNHELITADNMGIPYTVVIDEESLKTGLLKLRSRDTSLKETVHITDMPTYLLNVFEQ